MVGMLTREAHKMANGGQQILDAAIDSFRDFFKSDEKAAEAAAKRASERLIDRAKASASAENVARLRAEAAEAAGSMTKLVESKGFFASIGRGIGFVVTKFAEFGAKFITVPFSLVVMKPANLLLKGGTSLFTNFRRGAPILAVGAAAVGTANWLARRDSAVMVNALDAQAMAAEAQGAAPVSYMNSVPADMSAALDAKLQQGGEQAAGHTANLAARREVQAPESLAKA